VFLPRFLSIAAALCAGALLAFLIAHQLRPRLFLAAASRPQGTAVPGGGANYALGLEVFARPRPLPSVSFADASGRPINLAAFRGRVVLLNIWATWCVPCREEMPALDRLEGALGGNGLVVLPVSVDGDGIPAVRRFYGKLGLENLPLYADPSDRIAQALLIPGIPTSFLIDRDGREVARQIGPAVWNDPRMLALIRRYLPAAGAATREARR
jgi:thiol-disulfide isomerase/thioredoxin